VVDDRRVYGVPFRVWKMSNQASFHIPTYHRPIFQWHSPF